MLSVSLKAIVLVSQYFWLSSVDCVLYLGNNSGIRYNIESEASLSDNRPKFYNFLTVWS